MSKQAITAVSAVPLLGSEPAVQIFAKTPGLAERLAGLACEVETSASQPLQIIEWPDCHDVLEADGHSIRVLIVKPDDWARACRILGAGKAQDLIKTDDISKDSIRCAWLRAVAISQLDERNLLRHIAEGAAESIWELDIETGQYTFLVNNLAENLGYDENEWTSTVKWWRDHMHPGDKKAVVKVTKQHAKEGGLRRVDYRMRRKDGTYVWYRTHARIKSTTPPVRVYGFVENIEDLKTQEGEIERLNQQLLQSHRQAGMAEVASGVLHNVGNALNSINVSAQAILDGMKSGTVPKMRAAVDLIQPDVAQADPIKAEKAAIYVARMMEQLEARRTRWIDEAESIVNGVDHVSQSIARQQNHAAGMGGILEPIEFDSLVADAVALHLSAHPEIATVCNLACIPTFVVDKHKLMQVIVNLLRNAKHALEGTKREDPKIRVSLSQQEGCAILEVADNGIGIDEQTQARLFEYGFTTKHNGHGFGLHSSALAVQEMRGKLEFHSGGKNQGATFSIRIPIVED